MEEHTRIINYKSLHGTRSKITNFITKCNEHTHYQHALKSPPHLYNKWQDDKELCREYVNWIRLDSNCPSLPLDIPIPHEAMAKEAEALLDTFVKHRGYMHKGWKSLTIHGQGIDKTGPSEAYIKEGLWTEDTAPPLGWTSIAKDCPITVDWLTNTFPFTNYGRVRYMLLEPGGYILPHVDCDFRSPLQAYNIALSNPPGVEFGHQDAGTIPWQPGDVRGVDTGRGHGVINNGTENRIHMIIHGRSDPEFNAIVCRSYDNLNKNLLSL
jgi:hypothetical protein